MLKQLVNLLTITVLLLAAQQQSFAQDDEYESLFNGRDLDGWDGDPAVWRVEDGAIVGRNTAEAPIEQNTFLIWQGGEVGDFQLELEFKLEGGNSGIQYRSQVLDEEKWSVGGYQADMEAGPNYTGILYDERGRGILAQRGESVVVGPERERKVSKFADAAELQKVIRSNDWNEYVITARGNTLSHTINGELMSKTVDEDPDESESAGVLALQVHRGPPMTVHFRNLRLRQFGAPARGDKDAEIDDAPAATPTSRITAPPGFEVEMVYSVPRRREGSWVAMTANSAGRLYVSSENGRLYRVTPPPIGSSDPPRVERVDVRLGTAQGMVWAQDSLYVVVSSGGRGRRPQGLYRLRDSDGDDQLDDAHLLRELDGSGEHGPHAVILGPDGDDLYVVGGNHTHLPVPESSRVPRVWDEDQLLKPLFDPGGHAVGIRAPGGWICRTDLDGETWELISIGYRNPYDIAFNSDGELFTYDADMEWDIGAPWYRPTRICHVTSGSEFGWRTGSGKWPAYYPDSLPGILDVGPGSPTGVTFGYGSKFPEPYRSALFVCDWSFGALQAVHLDPRGASYRATLETFVTGAPLPLTDVVINPRDGAMYFTIGGRGTQSGLYRVNYTGKDAALEQEKPHSAADPEARRMASLRRELEQWHGQEDSTAVQIAWPQLSHPDRFVRFAARTAIEWQPLATWQERALSELDPTARIEAMIALARNADPTDSQLGQKAMNALGELSWDTLRRENRLALLRAYELILIRLPSTREQARSSLVAHLDRHFPSDDVDINRELCMLLASVDAPHVVERGLALQRAAATQEEQIHYALALRDAVAEASLEDQQQYFGWFKQAASFRGGYSLRRYVQNIRVEVAENLSDSQRTALGDVLTETNTDAVQSTQQASRPHVAEYSTDDVLALMENGLEDCDHAEGRRLFAAAQCFQCHRIDGEGGATGPDLTSLGNRFSMRDIVEAVVEPNKFVADRFRQTQFILEDGRVVTGRVANLFGKNLMVVTDMLDPGNYSMVDRELIESSEPVETSQMPAGLLNTLTEEEIRHLLAFLVEPQR